MKILIFTEGTILMHSSGKGASREERVEQVQNNFPEVDNFSTYVPVENAVDKITSWSSQGVEVYYLTSRRTPAEVAIIRSLLDKYDFPKGELLFRKENEQYKDVAEKLMPDILIEDDCESIGGAKEMTYTNISLEIKVKIKSIAIKEFGGIDHLSDNVYYL